jgi:hypothetical protein
MYLIFKFKFKAIDSALKDPSVLHTQHSTEIKCVKCGAIGHLTEINSSRPFFPITSTDVDEVTEIDSSKEDTIAVVIDLFI